MVNMYSEPIQVQYANTYVPLNFGELYRIGVAQNSMILQAADKLTGQLQKFGEFTSPSAIDTLNWYNLTIGSKPMQNLINKVTSNPDALKDPAIRAEINNAINSVDYSALSKIRQSRDAMLARQEANQRLAERGLFNLDWHNIDFANYDTARSGIFSDTAPMAYKSIQQLVEPYVNNLKPGFISNQNGWITKGVSTDRTDALVRENWSSIYNTPEYQMHKQVLMRNGFSSEDADDMLYKQVVTAGREFAYEDSERDPWWMAQQQAKMKADLEMAKARAQGQAAASNAQLNNLTTLVHNDGRAKYLDVFGNDSDGNPILTPEERIAYLRGGISLLPAEKLRALSDAMNVKNVATGISNAFHNYKQNVASNTSQAAQAIVRSLGTDIGLQASDVYTASGAAEKIADNVYKYASTANLDLLDNKLLSTFGSDYATEYVLNYADESKRGQKIKTKTVDTRTKFETDWTTGKFRDVIVEGVPTAVRLQTTSLSGNLNDGMYSVQNVYIPVEQLESNGYDEDQIQMLKDEYGTIKRGDLSKSITISAFGNDIDDPAKTNVNTRDKQKEYLVVPSTRAIQSSGLGAMVNDQQWMIEQKIGTNKNYEQLGYSQYERQNQ